MDTELRQQHGDASVSEPSSSTLHAQCVVAYDWAYDQSNPILLGLYGKAQRAQWVSDDRLPWGTDVDPERPSRPEELEPLYGSDVYARLNQSERVRMRAEISAWSQSQFLHGEQGALLAAAQVVTSVPDMNSKRYAASQVYDEARHVEVFQRYLLEKIGIVYPVSPHVKQLDDMVLGDSRWDVKLLGMQIVLEGLALAAFGLQREMTNEPLLKALTNYVMLDEARHVAFGITALQELYRNLPEAEVREREDLVFEAMRMMRDRFLFQEVWEKLGLPVARCIEITKESERQRRFRSILFAKIVPAVRRVGLLSQRQKQRFEELGIVNFDEGPDPIKASEEAHVQLTASRALSEVGIGN
jgi:hypothetical protein